MLLCRSVCAARMHGSSSCEFKRHDVLLPLGMSQCPVARDYDGGRTRQIEVSSRCGGRHWQKKRLLSAAVIIPLFGIMKIQARIASRPFLVMSRPCYICRSNVVFQFCQKKWLEGINRFQVYVPSIAIIDLNDREKSVGCSIMTIIWVKNRLLQES